MNCANHPDIAAVAYCRTCGKPLCANCTRDVRGVIYCENCIAERLQGVQPVAPVAPAAGFVPAGATPGYIAPAPGYGPPAAARGSGGPNPALAGILAGFFPFGVGAVYTGQYAKGLAHLLIFVGLILGMNQSSGSLDTICGLAFAFFYVWQIIDAVRTSHALQAGLPPPDPLGLGHAFGAGEKVDTGKIPVASIILIGIGVLFLLQTTGLFRLSGELVWPFFLIGLGAWLFAKSWGLIGSRRGLPHVRRMPIGPIVLVTAGVLSLIDNIGGPGWGRTWPVLMLAIGVAMLVGRAQPPIPPANTMPPTAGEVQSSSSEVNRG
jgi:cell wall-active antibiotic response 4TMS protein YvqF/B-box zinc finger protein